MGESSEGLPGFDPGMVRAGGKLHALGRLVRIEHTLFSLPYAYLGALLAPGNVSVWEATWIGLAVLGLRTAAMAFNNIADLPIDKENPRSRNRPLVTGALSIRDAWILVVIGSILYYLSAAMLNKYALMLSPVLWLTAMTYPYAKRLHPLPHIHLGLTLGLVVFGGAVAAYGDEASSVIEVLSAVPWIVVIAVSLWVAGFDVIYSIMDYEFDTRIGLGSLPAAIGPEDAVKVAAILHVVFAALMAWTIRIYGLDGIAMLSLSAVSLLLAGQYLVLYKRGFEAIPQAFNLNLAVGVIIGIGYSLDLLIQ